jgi:hypothetical protein
VRPWIYVHYSLVFITILDYFPQQRHDCRKASNRCHKRIRKGKKVCRVPRLPPRTYYGFKEKKGLFEEEDYVLLETLGLCRTFTAYGQTMRVIHPRILAGRYLYPANRCEHRTPTNPLHFYLARSSINNQVRRTSWCTYHELNSKNPGR